jgi:hypothetical protein
MSSPLKSTFRVKCSFTILCVIGALGGSSSFAGTFLGVFTTETVPYAKCRIISGDQRMSYGHMYHGRITAFAALDEAFKDYQKRAANDGYHAIVGFKPSVSSSVTDNGILVSWWLSGVGVMLECKD